MYEYHIKSVERVLDGDTIDALIDLGFSIFIHKRIRFAGIDTPETHTTDDHEKKLGLDAKSWLTDKLAKATKIVVRTELSDDSEKYGRVLGVVVVDDEILSLNEQLVRAGLAWKYDGGTKVKDLAALKAIRNA